MTTKIEEVARAIIGALKDGCTAEDLARAAIEAMRGPTEDMEEAGWIDKEDVCPCDIFNAMIDAALNEGKE